MTPLDVLRLVGIFLHTLVVLGMAGAIGNLLRRVRKLETSTTTITVTGVDPSQVTWTADTIRADTARDPE